MLQAAATDGTIYERYQGGGEVVVFEIASRLSMLQEFQSVYGMRFLGLVDPGNSVYQTYRVPDPEAPYPQDFVIDQDGYVRYWSWEYDPQEVMAVIDGLIGYSHVTDPPLHLSQAVRLLTAGPSPFCTETSLYLGLSRPRVVRVWVSDAAGREVRSLLRSHQSEGVRMLRWDGRDDCGQPAASGVYYVNLSASTERVARRVMLLR